MLIRMKRCVVWLLLVLTCLAKSKALPTNSHRRLQQTTAGPAPDLGAYKRAGCDNFTSNQWQPMRPAFHLSVPYGWMNDPHGMFQMKGTTHVFFQYNPKNIKWGAPFWGHVVSRDLARWTWLPPALLPDTPYDYNGCWSGAATVADGNNPVLTYTAASTFIPEYGNFFQQQALAVPQDLQDPWLKAWKKPSTNPFLVQVPPGGTNTQFRDPTEGRHAVWIALTDPANPNPLPKSSYALAIGVQASCLGGGAIYAAPSMTGPWEYVGNLYNQLSIEPQIDGQCMASRTNPNSWPGPAYGGPCDQFGAYCRMWEVVDFAELEPGVFLLKWDDQSHFRGDFNAEWYVLGNGPWDYSALKPPRPGGARASQPPGPQTGSYRNTSVFGLQYSSYPNTTVPTKNAANDGRSNAFNAVDAAAYSAAKSLFRGEIDGQRFAPMKMDYGSIYASMVFRTEDKRQVMLSWIYETAAGCEGSCSDQLPDVVAKQGFKGAISLPKQLTYNPATKTLKAYPVKETELLRGKQIVIKKGLQVTSTPTVIVPESTIQQGSKNSTTRQFEVQLNFTISGAAAGGSGGAGGGDRAAVLRSLSTNEFAVGLRVLTGGTSYTDIYLKGVVSNGRSGSSGSPSGIAIISGLSVWVDRRSAGGGTNTTYMEGGPVPLPVVSGEGSKTRFEAWTVPGTKLGLSVWVDHSVIEVYAMGGLARVTSRIYPEKETSAWGVAVWGAGPAGASAAVTGVDVQVWEMNNMWLTPNC